MILLSELLDEDGEAADQAKQMGLISKGWGRWADPRTGKVTHKSDGSRLVAVDPQQDKSGGEKEIGPKPTQSKLGQIAKDLKGKVGRASTKRQRAKAGADADFDAVEKLRQITDNPQDFEKASKMYHQGHDMKDIEAQFGNKSKNTGNVGMGSAGEKDRDKLRNKFLKKGTDDARKAKRLGDTRPHVVKNLSDKDLEKRMSKISDYMDDLKRDMRGATGSYKEKYEKATKDDREAFKVYHDEFEKRRKGKVGPKPGAEPDPSALNVKGDRANKLKRAQSLRQAWKQKGNAEAQATLARDFPKQYALDVVHQQGKDLTSDIQRGINGPEADNPQWRKDAAEQLKRHKERVAKIREMPDDTEFSDEEGMSNRRAMLDRLRGDGDDTVSGMSGKVPKIVRR